MTGCVTEKAMSCIILRSLNAILDFFSVSFFSVSLMIAERAGLKSAVNKTGLYTMINVVCLCVSSSSLPSLYRILYHFPLSEAIFPQ